MRGKRTKKERIWNYMKQHGSITQLEAWHYFHFGRLAGYVCTWKKNGIDIEPKTIYGPHGERWSRYFITRKEAERAEAAGLVYGKADR